MLALNLEVSFRYKSGHLILGIYSSNLCLYMSKMSEFIGDLWLSTQRGQAALEMLSYLPGTSLKGTCTILSKIPVRDKLHQHKRLGMVVHNHLEESCQYLARNHSPHPVPAQLLSNADSDHSENSMGA